MATHYLDDERAPLEFTKPSNRKKTVGCPHCHIARQIGMNCVGFICEKCHEYVSDKDFLPAEQCEGQMNQNVTLNQDFIKLKGDMEKKAYAFKDKVNQQRRDGTQKSHEPDGQPRKW